MKIKRFFASSLRDALSQVKSELGADAVILSNNSVEGGVELVAAVDYDENSVKQSLSNSNANNKANNKPATNSNKTRNNHSNYSSDYSNEPFSSSDYDVRPKNKVSTNKSSHMSPEWLKQLREEHRQNLDSGNIKRSNYDVVDHQLEDDVINFSQSRANKEVRREPKISNSRVDKLVTQDRAGNQDFSSILQQQSGDNVDTNERGFNSSDREDNPFDLDRIINETSPGFEQTYPDQATYSKPQNKVRNNNLAEESLQTYSKPGHRVNQKDNSNVHQLKTKARVNKTKEKKIEWTQDPILVSMKEEIQELRSMMQSQLSGLAWGNFNRKNPHRSEILHRLYKLGLKPSISETIIRQLQDPLSLEDGWKKALSLISRGIKLSESDLITKGGVVAFVGPTGVGKTTTIAKLASRFALANNPSDMALVSMDSYRVGAQEQLKIYAQLLRVPVYMVSNEQELETTLARLGDKRLVLIDTAGMQANDVRMAEQLSLIRQSTCDIKIVSVLSATAQSHSIHEVIDTFKPFGLSGCVVTKMDESTSLGGILSVLIENQLPLHYVTDGQKVPEDIRPGRVSNLLKTAMRMVRERQDAYDYNDIAMSFVGELLQANG